MRALLILGPTGSGKSALAMALARMRPVEIVSVDSAQVYRGLDIGTAKPSAADRSAVPHHLIDIRDPAEPYSAAQFVADAGPLITAIHARDRLPLLVGGTMLYARALLWPFDDLPSADPVIRARLEREAAGDGLAALHRRLAALDPASAARIGPGDPQRIQRALEVIEITGRPLSSLHSPAALREPDPSLPILSLEPSDRAVLHRRIASRFDRMLAEGLLDEVGRLRARGDLLPDLPALRSVGYRQAWECLDALDAGRPRDEAVARLRETGIAATRQLAKRQLTWLRALPVAHRLDCLGDRIVEQASAIIERLSSRT
jgi:tRNA dimethylallyltransferase